MMRRNGGTVQGRKYRASRTADRRWWVPTAVETVQECWEHSHSSLKHLEEGTTAHGERLGGISLERLVCQNFEA